MGDTKIENYQMDDVYHGVDGPSSSNVAMPGAKDKSREQASRYQCGFYCFFLAVFVLHSVILLGILALAVQNTTSEENDSCEWVEKRMDNLEKVINDLVQSSMITQNETNLNFKNVSGKINQLDDTLETGLNSNKEVLRDVINDVWIGSCTILDVSEWITLQRRTLFDTSFDRSWEDYENGFGDFLSGDFWLGLRSMNFYLKHGIWVMRTDFETWTNEVHWIEYTGFSVGDASTNYTLRVGSQTGGSFNESAGSGWELHDGMQFTTKDRDNDLRADNCASDHGKGGWWYKSCDFVNLNSQQATSASDGVDHMEFGMNGRHTTIKWSLMKIKFEES